MALLVFLIVLFLSYLIAENVWNVHCRRKLQHVIHVNGTRGKTETCRILDAVLRENYLVYTKTTGSAACVIGTDGCEKPVRRFGSPNIREQIRVVRNACREHAQVLIVECMAVSPEYQKVSQEKILKSDIGVITNVRFDHIFDMGDTLEEIAGALSGTVPANGTLYTADEHGDVYFASLCDDLHTRLVVCSSGHDDSCSIDNDNDHDDSCSIDNDNDHDDGCSNDNDNNHDDGGCNHCDGNGYCDDRSCNGSSGYCGDSDHTNSRDYCNGIHNQKLIRKENISAKVPTEVSNTISTENGLNPENVRLAWAVAKDLGITREAFLARLSRVVPDIGTRKLYRISGGAGNILFINLFSVNDPASTEACLQDILQQADAVRKAAGRTSNLQFLYNHRPDRPDRAVLFARFFFSRHKEQTVWVCGEGSTLAIRLFRSIGVADVHRWHSLKKATAVMPADSVLAGVGNIKGNGLRLLHELEELC